VEKESAEFIFEPKATGRFSEPQALRTLETRCYFVYDRCPTFTSSVRVAMLYECFTRFSQLVRTEQEPLHRK